MKVTLLAHTQLSGEFLDLMETELGISKFSEMSKVATDDVWRDFINSMSSTLSTNKNGVGRVD